MSGKPKPSAGEELVSQRCPSCKTTSKRSLVVCIDGTSNQFGIHNTNVVELYSHLTKNEDQRTFYNSGIGTYAKPHGLTLSQWIANKLDLAFAWRLDKVLLSAYRWLSENYEPGDRIFLFGFSRGAYQVRVLSAMIRDVGLIHKGNEDQIPFAYKIYADPNSRNIPNYSLSTYENVKSYLYRVAGKKYPPVTSSSLNLATRFKETFSRKDVKVHFVGVWDTVSSVGFVYGKTLPGTTDGTEHACFFRHALAMHERRVKFLPEFARTSSNPPADGRSNEAMTTGGDGASGGLGALHNPVRVGHQDSNPTTLDEGPPMSDNFQNELRTAQGGDDLPRDGTLRTGVSNKDAPLDAPEPHLKEVWFAGTHMDVGGGTTKDIIPFGPSLRWMLFESVLAGLDLGDDPLLLDPTTLQPSESMPWMWWILEILPLKRLSFLNSSKRGATVYWPHLGQWRRAFEDQKLHETALEVLDHERLPNKARVYLLKREEKSDSASALGAPVQWGGRGPALHPALKGPFKHWPDLDIESDVHHEELNFLRLLHERGLTRASDVGRLNRLLANEAGRKSIRSAIQKLILEDMKFTNDNHDNGSDDGGDDDQGEKEENSRRRVLSLWGSILLSILQYWDMKSEDPACARALSAVFRLLKHLDARLSFCGSRELRRLAKSFATRGSEGSEDFLLLVNSVMPPALDFPLREYYTSAVFHPDGNRVILGSTFANVCSVLDYMSTPMPPPLCLAKGDRVTALAVSVDGAFIGVALDDPRDTVLTIWDAASPGDEPIHTVENAPAKILCLALNHDGSRLVAGCSNGALIVWTKADGPVWSQLALFPDDPIRSISWSRDNYVAAGSDDGFLSIWDMGTASAPNELLPRTKVGPSVDCLAFAPMTTSGSSPIRIVTGGRSLFAKFAHWQLGVVEDGVYRLIGKLMGDDKHWPRCVTFSPDGKHIAAGMSAGMVRIWDADSCKPVCDDIYIPGKPDHDPLALSFEPDDTAVKAACPDGSVRLLCWK